MRFGNYDEKEFNTDSKRDDSDNVEFRTNVSTDKQPLFLDDQFTAHKQENDDSPTKNTWDFNVEDPYHTFKHSNPLTTPAIHRIIVRFNDLNEVEEDNKDEFLDDLNREDWADEFDCASHSACGESTYHGDDCCHYHDCDCDCEDAYESANDLYDFYNEVLNQYYTKNSHDPEVDFSWRQEDDPVDELVNRLGWITSSLLTGEINLVSAMDAIDNVYYGIEDDLNDIVHNDTKDLHEHKVGFTGDAGETYSCCCASDATDDESHDKDSYDSLYRKLTQLSWYLRKLREVLDLTETPDTDPDVNANKAGMLIEAVVHAIVWDDLLADALQNPDDDLERDFNKGCLEEDCAEMIKLLSHSKTNYVVGYAIRTWMNRLNDQVIGGLEALTRDHPVLRRLDNGRLIID